MAVKKKNRILVLAMTAVVTIFIAGGAYAPTAEEQLWL